MNVQPRVNVSSDSSYDEGIGISRGTTGSSKNSSSYSRYKVPINPRPFKYTGYPCELSNTDYRNMMIAVSKFIDHTVFTEPYKTSIPVFDERASQFLYACRKKIHDIREIILRASPLNAATVTAFTPETSCSCRPSSSTLSPCLLNTANSSDPQVDLCHPTEETTSCADINESPIYIMLHNNLKMLDSPTDYVELFMQTRNQPTADEVPTHDGLKKSTEVTSNQKSILTLQLEYELFIFVQSRNGSYTLISYDLANDNQVNSFHRASQQLDPKSNNLLDPSLSKLFSFNDGKIAVLLGKRGNSGTWKAGLYLLDTDGDLATWQLVSNFSPSISGLQLDFTNCFVVSCKLDEIIIITRVNDRIIFHIITKGMYGIKKKFADFTFPQLRGRINIKVHFCMAVFNNIYCALVKPEEGGQVYQFKLLQSQKGETIVKHVNTQYINDPSLKKSFILIHNGEVYVICCKVADKKTILEVKRLNSTLETKFSFQFPGIVCINNVSIVPSEGFTFAVLYSIGAKCYIERISL